MSRKFLTKDELQRFFAAINPKKYNGLRDYIMFSLMFQGGLRVASVSNLNIEDITLHEEQHKIYINIRKDKNQPKGRIALINDPELWKLLQSHTKSKEQQSPLFMSQFGNRLSVRQIQTLVSNYGKKANIPKDLRHPHALRHSCGTHLAKNKRSLLTIQKLLGHKNLNTTKIYLDWALEDMEKDLEDINLMP